jgi:MFS family permease
MVTSGGMDVVFVLLALDVFRTGDAGAALLSAALGAGTVIGGAATFALVGRQHLAPAMAMSAGLLGAGLLIVGTSDSAPLAPVLIAGAGIGYAAVDVIGRIILQRATPDAVLARVLGALEGIGLLALALGSVLVPVLAGALGPREALAVVALLLPAGVVIAWRGLRRIDRESKVPVRTLRLLQAAPVFAPLPAPQLEWVAHRARWITVEPGEAVIREGDVGDAYYVLEHGRMQISRSGGEQRVATDYGDGFGEIALLYGVRRTATVAAIEPSVLLSISRGDFLEIVTGHEHARGAAEHAAHERGAKPG